MDTQKEVKRSKNTTSQYLEREREEIPWERGREEKSLSAKVIIQLKGISLNVWNNLYKIVRLS